ncbi:5-oxopent-3-ene-1,2,5-tricarboxylate decarboxylase [Marinomonas sp. MED121]|uniref:fumarylacetoacetate hydrolase family protein n=1 Tax=Marinomonas sp. MED121 TaxID=314277 RepID=UPI0000690EEF|nr:fumarylacetoacetate hydrolase family protein [Marinomonas sp. MED121]EAQ64290.1 5-oxopent-3-ene-1,2,5-tricarboxylate decarboxylase [Marinomonas sp. MED121]
MRLIVGKDTKSQANPSENKPCVFLIQGELAINISSQDNQFGSDLSQIINNPQLLEKISGYSSAPGIPVSQIQPSLPLQHPGKVICLGLNYMDHIKEGGYKVPDYPALFMRSHSSLMPAQAPMVRPKVSVQLDYEAELMLIVGKHGRHIPESKALDYVFGYTIFNDGSVRDYQRKTHQWTPGKNFDNTGAIGPIIVTPDELPEGAHGLKIETRVGDEILQSANTSEMLWSVARVIAEISSYTTLEPGDLIAMGTPPGVGHARSPARWLEPGEVVEVEIEGIGICANPIIDEVHPKGEAS